jgi:hypothetical protein
VDARSYSQQADIIDTGVVVLAVLIDKKIL